MSAWGSHRRPDRRANPGGTGAHWPPLAVEISRNHDDEKRSGDRG